MPDRDRADKGLGMEHERIDEELKALSHTWTQLHDWIRELEKEKKELEERVAELGRLIAAPWEGEESWAAGIETRLARLETEVNWLLDDRGARPQPPDASWRD